MSKRVQDTKGAEEIDFLEEDDPIRGQDFVLLSFLSPEKVLQDKSRYFFNEFLKNYEISWKTKNLEKYLADTILGLRKTLFDEADRLENEDLSKFDEDLRKLLPEDVATKVRDLAKAQARKLLDGAVEKCKESAKAISIEKSLDSYKAFLEKNKREISLTKINADYDDFMFTNGDRLEDEFYKVNNFHTTIRGLKVRGIYSSRGEAELRAKKLQQKDKRHDILIGDVGKWLAWDPSPHQIPSQEYANDQLNTLMKAYNENEGAREIFYKENPEAKGAKNVKSVFNMSLEPTEMPAGVGAKENTVIGGEAGPAADTVTEATKALFDGPADLALARKMEKASTIDETPSA
jgi:hypothetical protein